MLTVDWEGNVSPCNLDTNMELAIGSAKSNSIENINGSREYEEVIDKIKAKEISPCKSCTDSNNWSKNLFIKKDSELL